MRPQSKMDFASSVRELQEDRILEVAAELARFEPASVIEHRMAGHLRAKLLMRQESLDEAITCLFETIDRWGEHVGLLGDLATCHYLKGDTLSWHHATDRLTSAFLASGPLLSLESHVRTALLIGKFEEERGELGAAIAAYEDSLRHLQEARVTAGELAEKRRSTYMTLAQLVRVRALYQPGSRLGDIYAHLLKLNAEVAGSSVDIEVEHSLMQAELALVGPESARARLENILACPTIDAIDRRLVVFDFIEACLRRGQGGFLPELRRTALGSLVENLSDIYEEGLARLAFGGQWTPDNEFVDSLIAQAPLANALRLMTLLLKRQAKDSHKGREFQSTDEIRRKALILIGGLSHEAKMIWMAFLDGTFSGSSDAASSRAEILIDQASQTVHCDGRILPLGRKKSMLSLLTALADSSELSLDVACRKLWDAEYNDSYYHRLRIQAHRLNELLLESTAIAKAIKVDSQTVSLDPRLTIKVK